MKKSIFIIALAASSSLLQAQALVTDEKSLVAAISAANADQSITKIVFGERAQIDLQQPVIYSGAQNLTLEGNHAIIHGENAGSFTLNKDLTAVTKDGSLIFNTRAALSIRNLSIIDSATRGLVFNIPKDATGANISIMLNNVQIRGTALYGLHIDDNSSEFDDGDEGSAIGIDLVIENSQFIGNGTGAIDFDGVRVDERGAGSISAFITNTLIDGNGGDGIELDEGGDGGIDVSMINVSVSDNGFYNPADLDDGFDIDESGPGDINAILVNVTVNNNKDEGLDFDESGAGDLVARMFNVHVDNSTDEGIKLDEEDQGDIRAIFSHVSVKRSGDDGIQMTELGEGTISGALTQVQVMDSAKLGLKAQMWIAENEKQVMEDAGLLQVLGLDLRDNSAADEAKEDKINLYNIDLQ